ncbi:MAG: TRAP transporter small permease [Proteobacteria bacterium]|nr:TRAP transporter small permease [Pseudomonadota bacterium]
MTITYPDDGPFARLLRNVDNRVGLVEQIGLVTLLVLVVGFAAAHALLDKLFGVQIEMKGEIVKTGTYAIAIFGSAYATHQSRHLAMDLISRRFSPRNRLVLKILLAVFAGFIVILMFRAGLKSIDNERARASHALLLSAQQIAWMIPIGSVLIVFHLVVHTLIDIDYLRRGKTPPERARSGH